MRSLYITVTEWWRETSQTLCSEFHPLSINQSITLLVRLYPQRTELRGTQILSVILRHSRGQSRFVNREPDCWGARVGKWNESGFRPPLCTYRLNWARRTSWGWWDDWDDTGFEIRARVGKPDQIGEIEVLFWMLKLFRKEAYEQIHHYITIDSVRKYKHFLFFVREGEIKAHNECCIFH